MIISVHDREGNLLFQYNARGPADLRGHSVPAETRRKGLRRADFRGMRLDNANFHGTPLTEADLRGASLLGANLSGVDLRGALYDATTKWPSGFNPKAAGAILAPTTT